MKWSRIKEYRHNNNYCELDGEKCTHCRKCDYVHNTKKGNFLFKIVLILLIIFICYLLIFHVIPANIEKHNSMNNNTLDEKVANYNMRMSDDERSFREWSGIGEESVGDNYNSIGSR